MTRAFGQSLSEYGLAIGLVALIGIGGLSLLGSQTADLLGNMIGQKGRGTKNLASASLIPLDSGIPARADSIDLTIPVTTLDGREIQISIKNYPTKITENDLLTGEDGGTMKRYALMLEQLATKLYEERVIDENQFQYMRKIANNGIDGSKFLAIANQDFESRYNKQLESQVDRNNFNSTIWMDVLNNKHDIQTNLKGIDRLQQKAGFDSNLSDIFDLITSKKRAPFTFDEHNQPLQALILDLSLKIGNGLSIPHQKAIDMANELSSVPPNTTNAEVLALVDAKENYNIERANVVQNSGSMCTLGKGTVDEGKVQCVKSLPE